MARIFLSDNSDSGVQRYNLSSFRFRDFVQLIAGLPRFRGAGMLPLPWGLFDVMAKLLTSPLWASERVCRWWVDDMSQYATI